MKGLPRVRPLRDIVRGRHGLVRELVSLMQVPGGGAGRYANVSHKHVSKICIFNLFYFRRPILDLHHPVGRHQESNSGLFIKKCFFSLYFNANLNDPFFLLASAQNKYYNCCMLCFCRDHFQSRTQATIPTTFFFKIFAIITMFCVFSLTTP